MPGHDRTRPFFRDPAAACLNLLGKLSAIAVTIPIAALVVFIAWRGVPALSAALFFGDAPVWSALLGRAPVWDGIWPACAGTLRLVALAIVFAAPAGVGTGVYLAEFAPPRRRKILDAAVDMLAGVPSIVMGLFGFATILFLRRTLLPNATTCLLLSAACLALLVLPSLVVSTREALEALPASLRVTAASLGLSRTECVRRVLLPAALPGVIGGVVLAVGRAAEDTAVIMLTGVVANAGLPGGLTDKFEAVPFYIYYTAAQHADESELARAFGAALVLLILSACLLAATNAVQSRYLRRRSGCREEKR